MRTLACCVCLLVATAFAGCAPKPPVAEAPPRVTKPARTTKPAPKAADKAARSGNGGFEFAESGGSGASVDRPKVDPTRRMAPSMEEMERAMEVRDPAPAGASQKWVCQSCGTEAREAGRCCGRSRVPVE